MTDNRKNIISYLNNFDFKTLFLEILGWDYGKQKPFNISINDQSYILAYMAVMRSAEV